MSKLSWKWLAALGIAVAGALGAYALGASDLAGVLGGAAAGLLGPARARGGDS
jgi:hypothetical protein